MSVVAVDRDALVAWVQASCLAQGLPEKVGDPAALRRIGVLLGVRVERGAAQGAAAPSTRPLGR